MKNPQGESQPAEIKCFDKTDTIQFQCKPGLSCFTRCCQDVNIFLAPYDILRMKNRLKIPSSEFLEKYTQTLIAPSGLPIIQLKLQESDHRCHFITPEGCSIYEDRPWACRMYPLDWDEEKGGYYFMVGEETCLGQKEPRELKLQAWLLEQEVPPYEDMDLRFQFVTKYPRLAEAGLKQTNVQHMFRMACYDLDNFRRFVFDTNFFNVFEVEDQEIKMVKEDDTALLDLAFRWIRFGLVCGDVLEIKEEVKKEKEKELDKAGASEKSD